MSRFLFGLSRMTIPSLLIQFFEMICPVNDFAGECKQY